MPTIRPRHQITETPEIAHAIDVAARRWPGEPRSRLLLRLVECGRAKLEGKQDNAIRRRRTAVEAGSGKYTDIFEPGYLAGLHADWPE